ncbi:anthrone oxygenase tpcL [Aspergillus undulatus]|uniref:anthrone oxygenase tpcL n=1 Tax=Aspergillus undulatus TaxID=1810928 RepID=UPI003CCC8F6C
MLCLSAIAVPVFLDTDDTSSHLVRQWARTYHYGHIILPAVCIATCGLYAYITLSKRATSRKHWPTYAAAGVTTVAMVPFTWVLMTPTNNTLFGLEKASSETAEDEFGAVRQLVVTWSWLHVTRSLFPLVGAIVGFRGLLQDLEV